MTHDLSLTRDNPPDGINRLSTVLKVRHDLGNVGLPADYCEPYTQVKRSKHVLIRDCALLSNNAKHWIDPIGA